MHFNLELIRSIAALSNEMNKEDDENIYNFLM